MNYYLYLCRLDVVIEHQEYNQSDVSLLSLLHLCGLTYFV